jgi:membrane peptidoglycan carboxypeptidase
MITSRRYGLRPRSGESVLPLFTAGYAGAGSTYKYFTTLAALKLGAQPDFTLNSGSTTYTVRHCPTDPNDHRPPYTTHNAGTYADTLPLSAALPQSVNTYFVALEDQFFGCNLRPIVQTALDLGMATLHRPQTPASRLSIAQAVVAQHQAGFTLGFSPTSTLELTAAYGTVANDGVFCPPVPIARVTGPDGAAVPIEKPRCRRELSPQVARTMVRMMTADTKDSQGTAASYFEDWYRAGGSPVAAKTGTDNDDVRGPHHGQANSALWFVGVTPRLTSAAALINPVAPKATVTGLPPNVTNNGSDIFGAYASTFWLKAFGSVLRHHPWAWRSPEDIPGAATVPDVTGETIESATDDLTAAGFKRSVASIRCGSPQPEGDVGYYQPHVATPGATITVCLSNGIAPDGYIGAYPVPPAPWPTVQYPSSSAPPPPSHSSPPPHSAPPPPKPQPTKSKKPHRH